MKRIKSCDPFYKGPRKQTVRKGDLAPPNDEDQDAPKSLLRLFKQVDKQGQQKTSSKNAPSDKNNASNKRSTPGLNARSQGLSGGDSQLITEGQERPALKDRSAMFVRKPGESTKIFLERIDVESKIRIMDSLKREKKSNRRKKYMKERKIKFKSRKKEKDSDFKDFSDFRDEVRFGDIVKAPPQLSAKPRASGKKSLKPFEAKHMNPSSSSHCPQLGLKHAQDLKEERTRAIAGYRMVKKMKFNRIERKLRHN